MTNGAGIIIPILQVKRLSLEMLSGLPHITCGGRAGARLKSGSLFSLCSSIEKCVRTRRKYRYRVKESIRGAHRDGGRAMGGGVLAARS